MMASISAAFFCAPGFTGKGAARRWTFGIAAAGAALALLMDVGTPRALAAPGQADPNAAWELYTRCWVPMTTDKTTLGLFHLDGAGGGEAGLDSLELALAGGAGDNDDLMGGGSVGGAVDPNALLDASPMPTAATALGDWKRVLEGRFGGAVRLGGGKSAIRTPTYGSLINSEGFSLDVWVQPERLGGALMWMPDKVRPIPGYAVTVEPGGELSVWGNGEKLGTTGPLLVAGEWRQVSLTVLPINVWHGHHAVGVSNRDNPRVELRVNGELVESYPYPDLGPNLSYVEPRVFFGNDAKGTAPLVGLVDELRMSNMPRFYYPWNTEWVDPAASRPLVQGYPWLRDEADLLAALPLDGDAALQRDANADAAGQVPPVTVFARELSKALPIHFGAGMHGSAVRLDYKTQGLLYEWDADWQPTLGALALWFTPDTWDNRKRGVDFLPQYKREYVPMLQLYARDPANPEEVKLRASIAAHTMAPDSGEVAMPLHPGTWYHLLINWEFGKPVIYINGERLAGHLLQYDRGDAPDDWPLAGIGLGAVGRVHGAMPRWWTGQGTWYDQLELYGRALSEPERANLVARFAPDAAERMKPLPFSAMQVIWSQPKRQMQLRAEVLAPNRSETARVHLTATGPEGQILAEQDLPTPEDGISTAELNDIAVGFGPHTAKLTYLNAAGTAIGEQTITAPRPQPAWYGNTLGLHPGEVPPGWTPMTVTPTADATGTTIGTIGRAVTFSGGGWPVAMTSVDAPLLASPIAPTLRVGGAALPLQPAAPAPTIDAAAGDQVDLHGELAAGDWRLRNTVRAEYDGLMHVTTEIHGPAGATLDAYTVDIPMPAARATFVGFWAGNSWFRGSADYRLLPTDEGVAFASNKTGRQHAPEFNGKVSWIPYLTLADDERSLVWFAETDENWTRDWETPSIEVRRAGDTVTLHLNIIHSPVTMPADGSPITVAFGLQPTPVKPMPDQRRAMPSTLNFGWVDGFSTDDLKDDVGHPMNYAPKDSDWDAAARRSASHRAHYNRGGYKGPFLYLDKRYTWIPKDAYEWGHLMQQAGGYTYSPVATDCFIWNLNEWISRDLIRGVYIDDCWLSLNPYDGYERDGVREPGVDFLRFRAFMKRLRWLFHDNDKPSMIWIHATQTAFVPYAGLADIVLEGEDRFLAPGRKSNFLHAWGLPRLRFSNPDKFGVPVIWMNKIGNEMKPPVPMPHWYYEQNRAYRAGLALNDIHMDRIPDFVAAGIETDAARFTGYWDPANPITVDAPPVVASTYTLPEHASVILVNPSPLPVVARFRVDLKKLALPGLTSPADLRLTDIDSGNPPAGEDVLKMTPVEVGTDATTTTGDGAPTLETSDAGIEAMLDTLDIDLKQEDADAAAAADYGYDFDGHNWRVMDDGSFEVLIRPWDYRLLKLDAKAE